MQHPFDGGGVLELPGLLLQLLLALDAVELQGRIGQDVFQEEVTQEVSIVAGLKTKKQQQKTLGLNVFWRPDSSCRTVNIELSRLVPTT